MAKKKRKIQFDSNIHPMLNNTATLGTKLNSLTGSYKANVVVNGLSSASIAASSLLSKLHSIGGHVFNASVNIFKSIFGFNGTAHVNGTISKFAQRNAYVNGTYSGDWGVPQDEDALVNELGEEIIIHDGKWRIANNGNMGFTHLQKGDVVLNHKQTEELLKNGYVSNSRAKLVGASTIEEKSEANEALTKAIDALVVVVENYPDLKASENFIQLQDELAGTENRIATARRDYNEAVKVFNSSIKTFPTNIFAGMFGFSEHSYFQATEAASEVPSVEF